MYPNLLAELARKKMTIKDLSKKTGIKYTTLYQKFNGRSDFFFKEIYAIKKALEVDLPIEYLLEKAAA